MQGMNWTDLQVFLAIAQAGQLARAGSQLGVNGTTAARRLRRLEAQLGASLFEQTPRGQVLTEAGEALLAKVEAMASAAAAIEPPGGRQPGSPIAGSLRISVSEGFGSWFLAERLAAFVAAYPGLTLDLVANSGFLSLSKREADVAITLSRPKSGPLVARKLSDYALRLYATPAYLAQAGIPAVPADLGGRHRLIGYIPDLIYAPELRYLDEIRAGLTTRLRSSSINAQHRLIAGGAGLGVLPCFIGDADPGLVPVLPQSRIVRTFWIVTHQDTRNLARIRALTDWLAQIVHEGRSVLLPPAERAADGT
ncbi:LysR family transcriptional regulator [Novosphingobium piscinae]|uniref:LysR family transcriptional regulator n=2 Tax=Novosphingobium piscinae TaxID=1507448 RepID=A0A7X1FZF0_9SPHN|nr:LysR family transcriptional regulator [Novosphingobium piscinae]MBC2669829.1 LysR family transcriptional regulator [Novosphingobium piscinae]